MLSVPQALIWLYLGILILACEAMAASPARIVRIVATAEHPRAIVSGGENLGFVEGQILDVVRPSSMDEIEIEQQSIITGRIKLLKVDRKQSVGDIIEDGTNFSQVYFGKFPQVMANDRVELPKLAIVSKSVTTPVLSLSFFDSFIDPKANPATYEISDPGKDKIREIAAQFSGAKIGKLLIEGHTDKNGSSSLNQVESYQRAMAIRQFLVDELGFDPERLVAVGLGESEAPENDHVPGYERRHRRLSFKLISVEAE
jgi:outer membrane protein OmpA-like peptidoglycan-associated protein